MGTTSIGWAVVNEAENDLRSHRLRLGVRVNPLTVDERTNFEKGKPITQTLIGLKRSMRKKSAEIQVEKRQSYRSLKREGFITDQTILAEHGNHSTFETYRLRAKAS